MTRTTQINIVEEAINVTLPSTSVKMLLAQPFLQLRTPVQEPFTLSDDCRLRMSAGIANVLKIAATVQPHVILFPEFAIPGVQAVEDIKAQLLSIDSLHHPLILIGGVDGLTRDEYNALCTMNGLAVHVSPANAPENVGSDEWVNTSVMFIKDDSRELSLWLQPKISPSWGETNTVHQSMFQGTAISVFRARYDNQVPCRFFSLVCYDWIGHEKGMTVPSRLLAGFNDICMANGSPQDIHFAFILQYNPAPNDHTFLNATKQFLTLADQHPFVQRANATIVMTCTAGRNNPGRANSYGYTSLVFGPRAPFDTRVCQPTFSTTLRSKVSDALGTCKDVVFREMSECVHAATVRVPAYVVADSTDRTSPLEHAEVFSFGSSVNDPRVPGASVSPVTKWVNDELDDVPDFVTTYFQGNALQVPLKTAHDELITTYRELPSQELLLKLHTASASRVIDKDCNAAPAADIEDWSTTERVGLHHVAESLGLVGSVANIDARGSSFHARCVESGVEIAAIRGTTHEDCKKALSTIANRTHSPILFVSRDDNNVGFLPKELESFVDTRDLGLKVTDAQTLLTHARSSTLEDYRKYMTELCNVTDRRVI